MCELLPSAACMVAALNSCGLLLPDQRQCAFFLEPACLLLGFLQQFAGHYYAVSDHVLRILFPGLHRREGLWMLRARAGDGQCVRLWWHF
mmetsp:Transcript_49606/g.142233  ORF Transcript_49606/g.142233 Transcript_49606/m.142233 type:complete len:90 (+) Transcript_49606:87-356(+)